jgi:hypothetical protein
VKNDRATGVVGRPRAPGRVVGLRDREAVRGIPDFLPLSPDPPARLAAALQCRFTLKRSFDRMSPAGSSAADPM